MVTVAKLFFTMWLQHLLTVEYIIAIDFDGPAKITAVRIHHDLLVYWILIGRYHICRLICAVIRNQLDCD